MRRHHCSQRTLQYAAVSGVEVLLLGFVHRGKIWLKLFHGRERSLLLLSRFDDAARSVVQRFRTSVAIHDVLFLISDLLRCCFCSSYCWAILFFPHNAELFLDHPGTVKFWANKELFEISLVLFCLRLKLFCRANHPTQRDVIFIKALLKKGFLFDQVFITAVKITALMCAKFLELVGVNCGIKFNFSLMITFPCNS